MAHRKQYNTGLYYEHDKGPFVYDWDGRPGLPQTAPRSDLAGILPEVTTANAVVGLASAYHGYKASGGSKVVAAVYGAVGVLKPLLAAGAVAFDTVRTGYAEAPKAERSGTLAEALAALFSRK